MLLKKCFDHRVRYFRPFVVLFYKAYSRVLLMLAENCLEKSEAPQLAFRGQYQAT